MTNLLFWMANNVAVWDGWAEMLLASVVLGCLAFAVGASKS